MTFIRRTVIPRVQVPTISRRTIKTPCHKAAGSAATSRTPVVRRKRRNDRERSEMAVIILLESEHALHDHYRFSSNHHPPESRRRRSSPGSKCGRAVDLVPCSAVISVSSLISTTFRTARIGTQCATGAAGRRIFHNADQRRKHASVHGGGLLDSHRALKTIMPLAPYC